jgi:hypothetical protein
LFLSTALRDTSNLTRPAGPLIEPECLLSFRSISLALVRGLRTSLRGWTGQPNSPFTASQSWTFPDRVSVHLYTGSEPMKMTLTHEGTTCGRVILKFDPVRLESKAPGRYRILKSDGRTGAFPVQCDTPQWRLVFQKCHHFLGLGFPTLCSGTMTCDVKSQETRSWKVKFIYKFTNNCPETKHLSPRRSRGKRSSMWSYWLLPKSADL